jgi:hypothetical protein
MKEVGLNPNMLAVLVQVTVEEVLALWNQKKMSECSD